MSHLTPFQWLLAVIGAAGIGLAKSGLSGFSMLHVLIFASIFGGRASTGVVLPMLLAGDVLAVLAFRQHARWMHIRRMLPAAATGVAIGAALVPHVSDAQFRPLIGGIILALSALQLLRLSRPAFFDHIPHSLWFAWTMGLLTGVTTMLANAAGPVAALYLLAIALPKLELVGTSAWLFFVLNCLKVPFSIGLGLIHPQSLALNATLIPAIAAGLFGGRRLVHHIPQRLFDGLLLAFAAVAALRLAGAF